MAEVLNRVPGPLVRWFALGLAILSTIGLALTAWILFDLQYEYQVFSRLSRHLPQSDMRAAGELASDLHLQHRLSLLLVLNIVGTVIAFAFVTRAYLSSEQSLRDIKVLSADIRASIDAAIITTDRNGIITSINPQGYQLIDFTDASLCGPLADIDRQHSVLSSMCDEVLATHVNIRNRDYWVTRQGHTRSLRASCVLLRDQRKQEIGTVVHVTDITEKALIEERLRRMERYMGLGALAAGLQHEIRNPLSAVSLHIQLLREKLSQQSADREVEEMLEVIRAETQRINAVLDGFGNYASMRQSGSAPVDLPFLITKLLRLLEPQASRQGVSIDPQLPSEPPQKIYGDAVRLEQVLLNLALNALAAMPDGGRLTFALSSNDESVVLQIGDTGHGIAGDVQSKIFDPYFTTRPNGTGMGLALCEKIISQHNGNIDFTTGPQGTVFRVTLPLDAAA